MSRRPRQKLTDVGARLPIRWRLALMTFGLLAVLLAALGTIVSVSEENTLLTNQATALDVVARQTVGAIRNSGLGVSPAGDSHPPATTPLSSTTMSALGYLAQQLSGPSTSGTVYSTTGAVLFAGADTGAGSGQGGPPPGDEGKDFFLPELTLNTSTILNVIRSTPTDGSYILAADEDKRTQLVVLLPIEDFQSQTTVAVLQVSVSASPILSAVTTTRLVLAIGIAAALLIAGAVMFPLLSAGLRPLVVMEKTSERIAGGALSLRLEEPPTHDEIGRFARSFNSMVAQLEAAFKRQKQFVADVSHELRTPLTALGGGLEMLMLGAHRGDPEAAHRLTRGMYREVERMQRLVEDLLTLTRLDEGQMIVRTESVAVGPLLAEVAEQAARMAGDRTLETSVPDDIPAVQANADRLRQVILSLVDNAVKYSAEDGVIRLSARPNGQKRVEIQVQDNGIGIPGESLPRVFERFYRVDPSRVRTQRRGGAGLGLSIAQSLVAAQGGAISIASVQGSGTTVTLLFPRAGSTHLTIAPPTEQGSAPQLPASPQTEATP